MNVPIVLDLAPDALRALRKGARAAGTSPTDFAAQLLARSLLEQNADRTPADSSPSADLLDPLRARLSPELAQARGWRDLQTRLATHGYTFRERGGGLALHCTWTAARICRASDLGWSYADLIRRFDAPFPGHFHADLAADILGHDMQAAQNHPGLFPDPDGLIWSDDVILIEDD